MKRLFLFFEIFLFSIIASVGIMAILGLIIVQFLPLTYEQIIYLGIGSGIGTGFVLGINYSILNYED